MDRKDMHFNPKAIDEQIEQLSHGDDPQFPSPVPEAQMVRDLQQLYREDESRLEHIWERLSIRAREESRAPSSNVVDIQPYQQKRWQEEELRQQWHESSKHTISARRKRRLQRLSLLCAEIVALLIIASLALMPVLFNAHSTSAPNLIQKTQARLPTHDLYMSTVQGVMSVNGKTGQVNWAYPIPDYSLGLPSSPIIGNNGLVYAESQDSIYAINAETGALVWKRTFASQISPYPTSKARAVLAGNAIYISVVFMEVDKLDASNGAILSRYKPVLNTNMVGIAIDNDTLYAFGSFDMCAINLASKQQIWYKSLNESLGIPHVVNGVIYTVASSNENWLTVDPGSTSYIKAFDTHSGDGIWQSSPIQGNVTDIAIANNVIYIGATNGAVTAYNMKTGVVRWSKALAGIGFSGAAAPQLDGDTLYISAEDPRMYYQPIGIVALDISNGHTKWQYPASVQAMKQAGHMFQPPVAQHGVVFVNDSMSGLNASDIYALVEGSVLWHKTIASEQNP
ncbi:PQQ-binding-like beta-propeller repeat protein [Dictyobacter kobayashii]|uniref:Pyrrolo-quinoline quinone repeat domain-containing protein n=1 Tax=Dictyobacter kobayashii TaxID=2014872 RepID=A0A402AQ56_9CHLR|nr:PQQ-binding-like beta-propeller repeat protein [Dictyobacter kobayashii]GCE21130.1 hypothetical protein KDK_49300 [Dictyobacter kobayashii]